MNPSIGENPTNPLTIAIGWLQQIINQLRPPQPRDPLGKWTKPGPNHARPGENPETKALDKYEKKNGVTVIREQRLARIPDWTNPVDPNYKGRKYDGLVDNGDGTYTGLEVKSGTSSDARQRAFDDAVRDGNPADVRLPNGQKVKITWVEYLHEESE